MGKGIDPCGWFIGGWGIRGFATILKAADVVSGPTTLSEFRKSFEIPFFFFELLPDFCGWSFSNREILFCP